MEWNGKERVCVVVTEKETRNRRSDKIDAAGLCICVPRSIYQPVLLLPLISILRKEGKKKERGMGGKEKRNNPWLNPKEQRNNNKKRFVIFFCPSSPLLQFNPRVGFPLFGELRIHPFWPLLLLLLLLLLRLYLFPAYNLVHNYYFPSWGTLRVFFSLIYLTCS